MKFFLYLLIKIIGITFFIFVCFFGIFFFFAVEIIDKNVTDSCVLEKSICIVRKGGEFEGIYIREDVKPWIKDLSEKVVGKMYEGASLYNPQGDVLPDTIDDALKIYIKEKVQ